MTSSKSVTTSLVPFIDQVVIVGASLAGLRAAEALPAYQQDISRMQDTK